MSAAEILGYRFADAALLDEALTTPSFRMTTPGARDNQRLEFLGDAVLGLLATDWLYTHNPASKEGELTGNRQHMVSTAALCGAAAKAGLPALLKRNKGAKELPHNSKTIADAVEALIGAAWLDGGMAAARTIFDNLALTDNSSLGELDGNPKSALQHVTQALHPPRMPSYKLLNVAGTSDKPIFTVEVSVDGIGSACGVSGSRKNAEAQAAEKLLAALNSNSGK